MRTQACARAHLRAGGRARTLQSSKETSVVFGCRVAAAAGAELGSLGSSLQRPSNLERDLHRELERTGRRLNVPIDRIPVPTCLNDDFKEWPVLLPSNFVKQLVTLGINDRLGGPFGPYWERRRPDFPAHPVYDGRDTDGVVPILLHGDEGEGRAKMKIMVVTWMSDLAQHRFIITIVPASVCKMEGGVNLTLEAVLRAVAVDLQSQFGYLVGVKGDWKFLKEAFCMNRGWSSTQVCWRCNATLSGPLQYSDVRDDAPWRQTLDDNIVPWPVDHVPALMQAPGFEPKLIRADILHNWHLGMCRDFAGAVLIQLLLEGTWGQARTGQLKLEAAFAAWSHENGYYTTVRSFTRANTCWHGRRYPVLKAGKGCDMVYIIKWLQEAHPPPVDEFGRVRLASLWAANDFLTTLQHAGLFLSAAQQTTAGASGLLLIRGFGYLASSCSQRGLLFYKIRPKSRPWPKTTHTHNNNNNKDDDDNNHNNDNYNNQNTNDNNHGNNTHNNNYNSVPPSHTTVVTHRL